VFTIPSAGVIAGSFVTDGKLTRNASPASYATTSSCTLAKSSACDDFKEDAREVQSGYECGIGLENYQDVKAGDIVEVFELEQVARRLTPSAGRGAQPNGELARAERRCVAPRSPVSAVVSGSQTHVVPAENHCLKGKRGVL